MAMEPKKKLISSDNDTEWSPVLAPDLIRSILERLNFVEFHRARSITSDWYSTAELCYSQNPTPWLILFSNYRHISCKLFDPLHDKTYIIRDLGFDFHRSRCLATSGSWFLMLDHRTDFYLLNLFTRERIHLPTLEAIDGRQMKFERVGKSDFLKTFTYQGGYGSYSSGESTKVIIENAVLWVDERSRDYLVVWSLECFFAYHKKGDNNNSWKVFQLKKNQDFTTERVKHFCLPPFRDHGFMALSVVGEEQLSVLQRIEGSKMEIFVTNKVDSEAALLWSKSFTVDLPIGLSFPEVFASLLIDEEKKVALVCNLALKTGRNLVYIIGEDSEYYSEIPYVESTNEPWWIVKNSEKDKLCWLPFIFSYVPSLVQIL